MNTRHNNNRHLGLRGRATAALRRALESRGRDTAQTWLEIGLAAGASVSAVLALDLFPDDPDGPALRLAPAAACVALFLGGALLVAGQIALDRRATRRWHRVRLSRTRRSITPPESGLPPGGRRSRRPANA